MPNPDIRTHLGIDARLCGEPIELSPGTARVSLMTTSEMAADAHGLVHGGFLFGLADYAAMLTVNDPNVVLGAANVRLLLPVKVGETVIADAHLEAEEGKKRLVEVTVRRDLEPVMSGTFTCFVLARHVLEPEAEP